MKPPSRLRSLIDILKLVAFLLDDLVVLVILLVVVNALGINIPLLAMIVIALMVIALIFIINRAVLPDFRRKPATGRESLVGNHGTVLEPLTPTGVVTVEGERWKAKSTDGMVKTGEAVEIKAVDHLLLIVKPVKPSP